MKSDVLTLAAIVLVVGMVISGLGITDMFEKEASVPPEELQQGVVVAQE